jgi:hypothetical protein
MFTFFTSLYFTLHLLYFLPLYDSDCFFAKKSGMPGLFTLSRRMGSSFLKLRVLVRVRVCVCARAQTVSILFFILRPQFNCYCIDGSYNSAVSSSGYTALDWQDYWMMNWKGHGRPQSWPVSSHAREVAAPSGYPVFTLTCKQGTSQTHHNPHSLLDQALVYIMFPDFRNHLPDYTTSYLRI